MWCACACHNIGVLRTSPSHCAPSTPLFVSNAQLSALVAALKGAAGAPSSNRPAQPLNNRLVTTYVASARTLGVSAFLATVLAVVALML